MDYQTAQAKLATARRALDGKPVANNTRIIPRDNALALRLHSTDVVTYRPDGSFTLNSGGWRTVTTKERMNRFAPVSIWSKRGTWHVSFQGRDYLYADGMTFGADGTVTGAAPESSATADANTRKRISKYAAAFVDALFAGEIGAPSGGDCWCCGMRAADGTTPFDGASHIESHLTESYFVPSLLVNALDRFGASIAAKQTAHALMLGQPNKAFSTDRKSFIASQIQTTIRKHCLRELGMAA